MFQWIDSRATERLLDDIRRINMGELDLASLSDAPLLQGYKAVLGQAYALKGIVSGHPRLTDGKEIITSQLFWLDEELGICRTMNRFYRLGTGRGKGH
ncbi:MAG: hypothetical protein QM684_09830 [Rhizobium sp.]